MVTKTKTKKGFMDTVKDFVTNPNNVVKGLKVSLGFGLPGTAAIGSSLQSQSLGMDVGAPADTDPDQIEEAELMKEE